MPTTINIDINSSLYKKSELTNNEVRYKQYFDGIKKIYEINKDKNIDIYISDNSDFFNKNTNIKEYIKTTSIIIIKDVTNNYGKINKGSGLIENWLYNKDILREYEWIIHFEPRQLLQSNIFIDSFLENPRNLFTMGKNMIHFNTGLFCINSKVLLDFINEITPEKLVNNNMSIEYVIYDFIKNNNIDYKITDKMDLIWFPTGEQSIHC
jgi:hypothetical protein